MDTKLFKGIYFSINKNLNKLKCYGLGIIYYKDKYLPIIFFNTIDTCVKCINYNNDSPDLGIIDSRNLENSLNVVISTYFSLFIISCIGYGSYYKLIK